MDYNWAALCIAIVMDVIPEQAFYLMDQGYMTRRQIGLKITDEDVEDMLKLHEEGISIPEIATYYSMAYRAAWCRMDRFKKSQ